MMGNGVSSNDVALYLNRIAHHETLIRRTLPRDYADILEAIDWISPTSREWVRSTNCFEVRYAERIPKQTKSPT